MTVIFIALSFDYLSSFFFFFIKLVDEDFWKEKETRRDADKGGGKFTDPAERE